MSRIHGARKRVELEQNTLQAVDAELERLHESQELGPVPMSAVAEPSPTETDSPLSSLEDATLLDSLMSACRRCTWTPNPETMLFWAEKEEARGTEEFRSLRSRLYQVRQERRLKSLLVTSALPGEGRSFVAANLAQVLALQQGCRVLLIDADLRKPGLHTMFGGTREPGFSEYLLQEMEEFSVMQRGDAEGLFLIPGGRSAMGPTELVGNGRLRCLLDRVEPLFDWIVIDSPPALPVSDAGLLADYCDGVLLVVRSESTPSDTVRKARMRFRPECLVGVVLNQIPPVKQSIPEDSWWNFRTTAQRVSTASWRNLKIAAQRVSSAIPGALNKIRHSGAAIRSLLHKS
jgi:protein-tyrosine kinase